MLQKGFGFITLVKTNIRWIRAEIDNHMEDFNTVSSTCPFDTATHGITLMLMHDFEKTRRYASHKSGGGKGFVEKFCRRIYLHIYFNAARQAEDRTVFETDLMELKTLLESGMDIRELDE